VQLPSGDEVADLHDIHPPRCPQVAAGGHLAHKTPICRVIDSDRSTGVEAHPALVLVSALADQLPAGGPVQLAEAALKARHQPGEAADHRTRRHVIGVVAPRLVEHVEHAPKQPVGEHQVAVHHPQPRTRVRLRPAVSVVEAGVHR
jgi:hypothetical protein